jgi:hypothetical protein
MGGSVAAAIRFLAKALLTGGGLSGFQENPHGELMVGR